MCSFLALALEVTKFQVRASVQVATRRHVTSAENSANILTHLIAD